MTEQLVIGPIIIALSTAVLTLISRRRPRLQALISIIGIIAYAITVGLLFRRVTETGVVTYQVSAWNAPFGIILVADALSVFMLALTAIVSVGALAVSYQEISTFGQRLSYHPLFHLLVVGISGSFLTGDIFNLFVWFEVMLMASYVLVVFYSGPQHTHAAIQYVVLNLVGSAVMLLAIGGIYALTGTLNMADISRRLADPITYGIAVEPLLGLSALLFGVFSLKSGIVPFHFWVPPAYRAAPPPIAAMLAGVVKKVGVYALIRLYFTVFATATFPIAIPGISGSSILAYYGPILFVMAVLSILVGGIAAITRDDIEGVLAYSSISQVGFIILPLAVAATVPSVRKLALTATLIYTLNHGLAKGLLFITNGGIEQAVGSTRFVDLGGLAERTPVLAGGFLIGGLSLVGIPPLIGFFGKLFVFDTLLESGSVYGLVFALLGAFLTLVYFSRAWNRGFWGPPRDHSVTGHTIIAGVVGILAIVVFLSGIGFEIVMTAAGEAATASLDSSTYITAVLGEGAEP